jgi:hypothetical protein
MYVAACSGSGLTFEIWVHSRKSEIFTGERAGQFRVEGFALQHLRQWQWQAVVVINSGGGVSGCGSSMEPEFARVYYTD